MGPDPGLGDEPLTWQERLDVFLFLGASVAFLAMVFGLISFRTLAELLGVGLVVTCVAYVLSVVREDEDRPRAVLLMVGLAAYAAVDWVAFKGAGPTWLQSGVLVVLLILYFSQFEGRAEADPTRLDDHPPPF